jgi:D-ornithine---citrate ligase
MHVIEESIFNKISFIGENKLNNNSLPINDCILEVNKRSLKQLLLAFLREKFLIYHYRDDNLIFELSRSNYVICVSKVKLASLLRITEFDSLFLIDKKTYLRQAITNPLKLLDIIKTELGHSLKLKEWDRFCKEIANHLQNALLSQWKKYSLMSLSVKNDKKHHDFFKNFLNPPENLSDYSLQFEQSIFNGHPYHPCAKTKLGFTMEDTLRYSPEFRSKIDIFIAAVDKKYVHIEAMEAHSEFKIWFAKTYPKAWETWLLELKKNKLNIADYIPFPVHPWQLYYFIFTVRAFTHYFRTKIIILFDNVKIMASPTLSFRTVLPTEGANPAYIKLPVAVQATSVFRTLSALSTKNAPKISRALKEILIRENYFSRRLDILSELYGLHLPFLQSNESKHFSAIFRENVADYLQKNEVAIVLAAFFEKLPANNNSLFIEIMQLAGYANYQAALNYFYNYTDLVLGGYLDLYLQYGIALEGHQQNTFAVFQNGCIKRFIARDVDGIEIHPASLNSRGIYLDISADSPHLKNNKRVVRNQLLHTVYQLHLGELVLLLANYFDRSETDFWNIVKDVTKQRFYQLKNQIDATTWDIEYHAILRADWPLKALLRMRLEKNYLLDGLFSNISNPLAT